MNKTQVTHLQQRLTTALDNKINEKFKAVAVKQLTQSECNTADRMKAGVYQEHMKFDLDKYPAVLDYLHTLARYIRQIDESKAIKQAWPQEDKDNYHKKHTEKLNEILDIAILGDSGEALKALKEFQGGL